MNELSIEDLDHVTGGEHKQVVNGRPIGNGTGGGDGLGWLRNLLRGVVGSIPQGAETPAIQHENVHAS